ncbi:MAG TPA: CHAP domain-containing protein [Ignavibacteria bacterium]|nr:CHAP domain-containing protein [Ignavibacteria bacterium]HMR39468.1 CHAP domain-containing protein [Ignavibacteria bacterium]
MNYPNRVIKKGEKNKTIVKALQEKLNEVGCGPIDVDGDFGPQTFKAVKQFQATRRDQNGDPLEIDGKVGSITWAVMFGEPTIIITQEPANEYLKEALKIAVSQIGVMEKPLGSNRGPEVDKYLASVGLGPGQFWCMAFVYYCFDKAAEKLGRNNPLVKTGHCMTHWNSSNAKKILASNAVNNPSLVKPGQIFIINTGGSSGHTGIVEKLEGGFLHTIEGNSNTSGSRNGIGVFRLKRRKITKINRGFLEYK